MKPLRRVPLVLGLALLPGCWLPWHSGIDGQIKALTAEVERNESYHARDPLPAAPAGTEPLLPDAVTTPSREESPRAPIRQAAYAQPEKAAPPGARKLFVPPELPGA